MLNSSEDALVRFENSFYPEEKEKLFLVKSKMGSPSKSGGYFLNGARYIACIDCDTDEFHPQSGTIRWMYKFSLFHKQDFDRLGIYKVKVRESRKNPRDHMIVKIIGKANDPKLNAIREEYLKPVILKTELGTFELDRDYDEYKGTVNYLNQEIPVYLNVEEGKTDASIQLQHLKEILSNQEQFDNMVRQYIADDKTLWSWLEDGDYPREGFEKNLTYPALSIEPDGNKEIWFDGGDPFGGHSIVVSIDQNNTCKRIDLVG